MQINASKLVPFIFWSNILKGEDTIIDKPLDVPIDEAEVRKIFYLLPSSLLLDIQYVALVPAADNKLKHYATTPAIVQQALEPDVIYKMVITYDVDALLSFIPLIHNLAQFDLPPFAAVTDNDYILIYLPKPVYEIVADVIKRKTSVELPVHEVLQVDIEDIDVVMQHILEILQSYLKDYIKVNPPEVADFLRDIPHNLVQIRNAANLTIRGIVKSLVVLITLYGYTPVNALILDFLVEMISNNPKAYEDLFNAGFLS